MLLNKAKAKKLGTHSNGRYYALVVIQATTSNDAGVVGPTKDARTRLKDGIPRAIVSRVHA